ncbi:ribosomal protein S5 domain 2-like protein [Multifurca ochricompacta]|uniref:Ribosomal protein S5 domain 2-like protein n=1 Tax=Multifurca ochricompacta TaxID=376703 RepID=A0AAD4QLG6_9AGAM|nr:ribosomal protein S5 domain 2-like protein [Multifurca ochricompacta]
MRPPSPSIAEKDFFFNALNQNLRLDGRELLEPRQLGISFGSELGHVECSLGKTRVLAHVDAKMVRPEAQRPFEGLITIHCELSPMAGSEYEPGRQSDEEIALARMLDKIFRRSDAIDRETLCIIAGERVWHLHLSIHALADAGGLLDCASLASAAALRHFRRSEVEVIGAREVIVHDSTTRAPVPLAMHHTPFCVSFAFYSPPGVGREPRMLLDPAGLEQRLAHGMLTLALTPQRELAVVHKAGGLPLAPESLMGAVQVAARRARELEAWLDVRVREDWGRKKVEVR